MPRFPLFLLLCALPACTTVDVDPPAPPPPKLILTCDASDAQRWIGARPEDVPLLEGQIIRVVAPGQRLTMDYRVERLNLFLTADGIIHRVTCG